LILAILVSPGCDAATARLLAPIIPMVWQANSCLTAAIRPD
jgi:hypothetical protein